jgi:hypothetical protein
VEQGAASDIDRHQVGAARELEVLIGDVDPDVVPERPEPPGQDLRHRRMHGVLVGQSVLAAPRAEVEGRVKVQRRGEAQIGLERGRSAQLDIADRRS